MTYCFNKKSIIEDSEFIKYVAKLQTKEIGKEGPFKIDDFTVWKATGFRYYESTSFSVTIITFFDILIICAMIDNRVYYWYVRNGETYFEYDNFMFHPKYKVLANVVYNLYHRIEEDHFLLGHITSLQPWKIFSTHQIFSPTCKLGREYAKRTNIFTLDLCIAVYGEYDEENFTNMELTTLKPWDVDSGEEYDYFKLMCQYTFYQWKKVERYLYECSPIFNEHSAIHLEWLLCDIRSPFEDEAYKLILLALDYNMLDLYKWIVNKYSNGNINRKRLLDCLDNFPKNSVSVYIKNQVK